MSATDELRQAADRFDGYQNGEISRLLRDAADTIWELRGALLVAAKEHRELEAENAELRELVVEVFDCARRGAACETCKVNNDGYACVYIMRELGVEVER